MPDIEEKASQLMNIRYMFLSSIIAALSLVVGLFWNDAIKSLISDIIPSGEGTLYKFFAAIAVTIVIVVIIFIIIRSQKIAAKAFGSSKNR